MLYVSLTIGRSGTRVLLQCWVFATHCTYLKYKFATSFKFGFLDLFQFLV